ncbi:MAG: tryptophan--tRNA ligase [Pseudomonadota bacterium]
MNKIVVSGIQPSGTMHIGNYLGAIKNWINLQDKYNCFFFLADLHTITVAQEPEEFRNNILSTAASLIASGLDPKLVTLFAQSSVAEHTELGWILNCMTPMGWLERMTQFKDKAGEDKERASLGLFSYPVLQSADVLLYKADFVPVGEDQRQHLELARDIAASFNRHTKTNYFKLPEAMILKEASRIMSLRDGTSKMSKSDPSDYSRINLIDSPDVIVQKIKKAKTDSIAEIFFDKENRPEISNLLEIYAACSDRKIVEIVNMYEGKFTGQFKADLAEVIIEKIGNIGKEITRLYADDQSYIKQVLKTGAKKASILAKNNMSEIKELCGFNQF